MNNPMHTPSPIALTSVPSPLAPNPPVSPSKRRRHGWKWWTALAVSIAVLWWGLTASPLVRWVISSQVRAMTGAQLTQGRVSLSPGGHISISGGVLRIPGIEGTGGELLRVDRLDAAISWSRLLGITRDGKPVLTDLFLLHPTLRLSQNTADGTLNLSMLKLPASSGEPVSPPRIQVDEGRIELGEHTGNSPADPYTVLKRIDLRGRMNPATLSSDGTVEIVLTPDSTTSADPSQPVEPVRITGSLQNQNLALAVSGLSLKDWPASAMPGRIRQLAQMLDMTGAIGKTTFAYSPASGGGKAGIRASAELIDVSVNLPVTDDGEVADTASRALLRMNHVNGSIDLSDSGITARLIGSIEEVPYTVDLKYDGNDAISPFSCVVLTENFRMEKDLRILRFVPPLVRERLADFSWPTGLVTSHATISRGEPVDGKAAPLSVVGDLELRDAVSAFKRFPYEFRELSGKVKFSDARIDILDIKGRSPAGAIVTASGFIEPPTGDAHCVIDVHVEGMRIDDDVIRALMARRKGVPPVLFNQDHYNRMLAAGLIARPGDTAADASIPRFGIDGMAKVHTKVTRKLGPDSEWIEQTNIDFESISILPEWFPLPMVATGVRVEVDDNTMTIRNGEYRPIVGGVATASADVDYRIIIDPAHDGSPEITVNAKDIPAGRLLHYAIGAALDRAARGKPGGSAGPRLRGILDDLSPVGLIGGTLRLYNDEQMRARVAAKVNAGPLLLRPHPEEYAAPAEGAASDSAPRDMRQIEVAGAMGEITIADRTVDFDFKGRARTRMTSAIPSAEDPPPPDAGLIHVTGHVAPDERDESALRASVEASEIDLAAPIDQLVGVFSPSAASRWSALAAEYHPSGRAGGTIEIAPSPEGSVATVTLNRFDGLGIRVDDEATVLKDVTGSVVAISTGSVRFDGFAAQVECGQARAGKLSLSGSLAPSGEDGEIAAAADFKGSLTGARAESAVLRRLASRRLSPENAQLLRELDPRGEFDATFEVRTGEGIAGRPGLVGVVNPHSLAIRLQGVDVPFDTITGEVSFTPAGGQLRAVEGTSDAYSLRADGSWSRAVEQAGDVGIDLTITGWSRGMAPGLRAMLPVSVGSVMKSLEFDVDGRVDLTRMQIQLTQSDDPQRQRLTAFGKVQLAGGKMVLGLPVTGCDGVLDFRVDNSNFDTPPAFAIMANLDRFKLSGLAMTQGIVEVQGMPGTGEVKVPKISAACYGGRFVGSALIGPSGTASREFESTFGLTGVRFAPMLRDVTVAAGNPLDEKAPDDNDATRGLVDAKLSIGGKIDSPASRRGVGSAQIAGPSVMRMPLVMPLIRVSNLQLPTDEPLELATASFYIDGSTMAFEDLSVFSQNVHILGFGTMTWPEMALDLRFNSRAVKRIPIINWLLEGIRDQVVTTRVSGTLAKPEVSSVPFDQTRRFFLDVFGKGIGEQDRRMLQLEKEAEKGSDSGR